MPVRILCEHAELAIECLQAAEQIGWTIETEIDGQIDAPTVAQAANADPSSALGIALLGAPTLEQLVVLGHLRLPRVALAILERTPLAERLIEVARDLGITAVRDVAPLLAALRLLDARAQAPWAASLRTLPETDRARLRPAQTQGARSGDNFLVQAPGTIAFASAGRPEAAIELGSADAVCQAVAALRETEREQRRVDITVADIDDKAVLDVLFGPRRALSDPASKLALEPYGIPMPTEELCASASRAAAEAARIGFPVRISLASPDLRVWDYPELSIDMVDNAARVRDTFRQLMGLARSRLDALGHGDGSDRVLGVLVTATSASTALLGARAWPLPQDRVALEVGFADPHGAAADDRTLLVMPANDEQVERALRRLAGHTLIMGSPRARKRPHLASVCEVLQRLCAFVHDRRYEVSMVELRPIALLVEGSVEVREACVTVSDAFERMLHAPASARPA